jgi:hypothetical protein
MANGDGYDVRAQLLELLLRKVDEDTYPSTTMLNMIEELLTPDDVEEYAETLLRKMREETYPSIPMLARLSRLA